MRHFFIKSVTLLLLMIGFCVAYAQDNVTIVAPTSEAAEGLDLHTVSELFQISENLEEFEKALNDPEEGINNLDLDENGDVDYIRVVEEVAGDTHVIILQAALGEDQFQDVATIEIEKAEGDDEYNMQVHGNDDIYGEHYYVAPTHVHIHSWPIIVWIYGPAYRPYRSAFYFGFYPRWWRPYRPVTINVYRTRTVKFTKRTTFSVTRTTRVRSLSRVKYKPRTTTLVKKRTTVRKSGTKVTKTTKVTKMKKGGKKKTTVKKTKIKKSKKGGKKKTTVKKTKIKREK